MYIYKKKKKGNNWSSLSYSFFDKHKHKKKTYYITKHLNHQSLNKKKQNKCSVEKETRKRRLPNNSLQLTSNPFWGSHPTWPTCLLKKTKNKPMSYYERENKIFETFYMHRKF